MNNPAARSVDTTVRDSMTRRLHRRSIVNGQLAILLSEVSDFRTAEQQCYTTIFTAQELDAVPSRSPLQLVGGDSAYDYQMTHLPAGAWPPTSWYAVSGRDVFDLPRDECPIEMRRLVYQKPAW